MLNSYTLCSILSVFLHIYKQNSIFGIYRFSLEMRLTARRILKRCILTNDYTYNIIYESEVRQWKSD